MSLNFIGQNFRGHSFRYQNLEGANFSYTNIQGVDFTNAYLRGAKFIGAKAGLQRHWTMGLVVASWLMLGTSGYFGALPGYYVTFIFNLKNLVDFTSGVFSLIVLIVFFIITIYHSLFTGFEFVVVAFFIAGVLSTPFPGIGSVTLVLAFTVAGAIIGVVAGAVVGSVVRNRGIIFTITISGSVVGAIISLGKSFIFTVTWIEAIIGAAIFTMLSVYIGLLALKGDEKHSWIRSLAIICAAKGGTSFRNADLTEADFTSAILKSTDFKGATLARTCFYKTQMLDSSCSGKTYLQHMQVCQMLVTGQGQNQSFDRQDLRGVNFQGANLADASFVGTDLSEANLQDADLSRAKLVQTQLDGTDLTGATLTGATIEDWGITIHTKLHGVRCEYVFMRSPTPDDPNPRRKPDNWNETFADGDFADFIKPIVDTLDLYHNSGVDPRAIAISFKQLAENHPEAELRIVGMEVKGEDKFLLRAKTASLTDKSELSAEYFTIYNELKALAQQEVKALISEKDYQIHRLENMVTTALERPSFYAQNYNNQGDTTMSGDRNINMGNGNYNERIEGNYVQGDYREGKKSHFNLQGAQFAGGLVDAETVNAHQIGGNITNNTQAARTETNNSAVKTILILASNPRTTSALRLDEEVREIDTGLQRSKKRELFDLKQRWAVRVQDVYQSLLDFNPSIVHFSGHGSGDDGLVLEDEAGSVRLVETVALAGLFEVFASTIECVVLNACYSEVQARAIAQHIPYVIGMNKAIGDRAAIKFATGFYSALGAGESVEFAYKLGCSVIQLDGIAEHLTPVLKKK